MNKVKHDTSSLSVVSFHSRLLLLDANRAFSLGAIENTTKQKESNDSALSFRNPNTQVVLLREFSPHF